MDVVYTRCCGLDIHKKTVVACLILSTEGAEQTASEHCLPECGIKPIVLDSRKY